MSTYFQNKVAIITGGSEGIGKSLVEALLAMDAKVATCARNQDKLYDLMMQNAGKPLYTMVADVSRESDCKQFIESTVKAFGGIDIIINNAGISMKALVKDTTLDVLRSVMEINFWGMVYCTKYALPYILDRKGTIVGVSSIAGYRGLPGRSGYSASKFAMNGWLESLRAELLESGVNVMWVAPGFTSSNIRFDALNPKAKQNGYSTMNEEKLMSSDKCASFILRAIKNRRRTLILTMTGWRTVFVNRLLPNIADLLIRKFYFKNGELVK
ncbi:MAG: SDR family oxidoreductase [Chitinophagaceae bacterium]